MYYEIYKSDITLIINNIYYYFINYTDWYNSIRYYNNQCYATLNIIHIPVIDTIVIIASFLSVVTVWEGVRLDEVPEIRQHS